MNKQILLGTMVLLSILYSCKEGVEIPDVYKYQTPAITNDGWEVDSLSGVGVKQKPLVDIMNRLFATENHNIHSILIIKNSKLVFEEYFPGKKFKLGQYTGGVGYTRDDTHTLCSATKSFASALMGIALDEGLVASIDKKVFDYFPENSDLISITPAKGDITIKQLLTMTAGIFWNDEQSDYYDSNNDMYQLFTVSDPMRYILSRNLYKTPGTFYDYANCNTNLIGEIVHRASGKRLDEFCDLYLFSRLGITNYEWQKIKPDIIFCSGDLMLRPRDMAKFGLLFLNDGLWKGEQLISKEWCVESTAKHINPNDYSNDYSWSDGYGYQWWQKDYTYKKKTYNSYFASGWGGQCIIVIKELDLVIVTTAGNWNTTEIISPYTIVSDYIIPAVVL